MKKLVSDAGCFCKPLNSKDPFWILQASVMLYCNHFARWWWSQSKGKRRELRKDGDCQESLILAENEWGGEMHMSCETWSTHVGREVPKSRVISTLPWHCVASGSLLCVWILGALLSPTKTWDFPVYSLVYTNGKLEHNEFSFSQWGVLDVIMQQGFLKCDVINKWNYIPKYKFFFGFLNKYVLLFSYMLSNELYLKFSGME